MTDSNQGLGLVGVEVWRLQRRLETPDLSRERLLDSLRRLTEALSQLDVRISDPIGAVYVPGSNAEVVASPEADAAGASLVISQVLRPAVFVNGTCVIPPQVVLARGVQNGAG